MEDHDRNHVLLKIKELEAKGYKDQLKFENGKLTNLENSKSYDAEQVSALKEYRFEGMSNPDDMSILFALEFDDGRKGTLVAAYGPKGDPDLFEFLKKANGN